MDYAPLYNDLAEGPEGGNAYWVTTSDGVRLRIAHWAADPQNSLGTVLLFPGRTEFVEKYGRAAVAFRARGYATLAIDWRGQGLADRQIDDPMLGHVKDFSEYQLDIAAMLAAADQLTTGDRFLVAHSMGGCIGLRALHSGLSVKAAAFTAPMWGMSVAPVIRPFVPSVVRFLKTLGKGQARTPGTDAQIYVLSTPFEENTLTSNPDMYAYMQRQSEAHPEMSLKGPSVHWVTAAFAETRALRQLAPPNMATVTFLGSNESIVDPAPIHHVMQHWSQGRLVMSPGSEHEIMMELPAAQDLFFNTTDQLFKAHSS